jgi:hypothetical protein
VLVHNGFNCIDTPVDMSDPEAVAEIESGFESTVSEEFPYGEHELAASKGFPGIRLTEEGGPSFAGTDYLYPAQDGELNTVKIKLTGGRTGDYDAANALAGFEDTPEDYVWHHVDDFDPATGDATLELVQRDAHVATYSHNGGVSQYEAALNTVYGK